MKTFRIAQISSAILGLAAASTVSASTVTLSNASSTGGLDLNASSVLLAAGANASTTHVVQGVTFAPLTASGNYEVLSGGGVTITVAANAGSSAVSNYTNSSPGFEYAASSVSDSTLTYGSSGTLGFSGSQPNDALQTLIEGGLEATNTNVFTITISGLTSGKTYVVDLLQSNNGYGDRTQTVAFNGVVTDTNYLYSNGGNQGSSSSFGYDTNETATAVGGQIVITLTAEADSTTNAGNNGATGGTENDTVPLFNDVVVSSVPEPASLGLLGMGGLGLLARRRRR